MWSRKGSSSSEVRFNARSRTSTTGPALPPDSSEVKALCLMVSADLRAAIDPSCREGFEEEDPSSGGGYIELGLSSRKGSSSSEVRFSARSRTSVTNPALPPDSPEDEALRPVPRDLRSVIALSYGKGFEEEDPSSGGGEIETWSRKGSSSSEVRFNARSRTSVSGPAEDEARRMVPPNLQVMASCREGFEEDSSGGGDIELGLSSRKGSSSSEVRTWSL